VQFPTYVALSLLLAWLFRQTVEVPFIRWSRAVGKAYRHQEIVGAVGIG
jgi:hypothetical protein